MNYLPSLSVENRLHPASTIFDPRRNLRASQNIETDNIFRQSLLNSAVLRRTAALPFKPLWTFGMDIISKIINLTTKNDECKICYSVNQLGVIYNQSKDSKEFLIGHQNLITSMATDQAGEWLVTADNGKDNTIIVWEVENCFPVCTIFDPHPEVGVAEVGISQDAKYLVSVGAESDSVIKFWMWTLGNDDADATYITKQFYGLVKNIAFNPNNTTMFAVTFLCGILFCTWKEGKKKLLVKEGRIPLICSRDYGDYSQSLYGPKTHECYTVTINGWVLIWGRNFHKVPFTSVPVTNNKIFLKAIKLDVWGINSISYVDGYIQTTNCKGRIRFYDNEFKIVYSYIKNRIPPALQVSFNLKPRKYIINDHKKRDDNVSSEESQSKDSSSETAMYLNLDINSLFERNSVTRTSDKRPKAKVSIKEVVEVIMDPKSSFASNTSRNSEQKTKCTNVSINKTKVTVIMDPNPSFDSNSTTKKSERKSKSIASVTDKTVTINPHPSFASNSIKRKSIDSAKEHVKIIMDPKSRFNTNSLVRRSENNEANVSAKEHVKIIMDPKSSFNTNSLVRRSEKNEGRDGITDDVFMSIRKRIEKKSRTSLDAAHYNHRKSEYDANNDKENIPDNSDEADGDIEIFDDYEVYLAKQLHSDFTLNKAPFIVRNFIILTMSGNYAYVDMVNDKINYFMEMKYSPIVGIDIYSEKEILVIAYEDNWIHSYNYYETCLLPTKIFVPQYINDFEGRISCIKYSYKGYFLVIGTTKGTIIFLNPVTMEPLKISYTFITTKILDIIFSTDNNYIACRDAEHTVLLIKMSKSKSKMHIRWICHGRIKCHRDDITGMLFCRVNRLFTIGKDRLLVEYDVKRSQPNYLDIIYRIPVLQRGYPTAFTTYELVYEENNVFFLITTNEHKHIIFSEHQTTVERKLIAPTLNLDEFIYQLQIVPDSAKKCLVYRCGKHLGLQLLPISGNPFSYKSIIAHSSEVSAFRFGRRGEYVFTYGVDDTVCVMWEIRMNSVEYQCTLGGRNINPYLDLIEGGRNGPFFKEILDIFYFMQILHQGDDSPQKRSCADKIAVTELPNFLRAVGYFPSENELDSIMYEASSYYLYKPMIISSYHHDHIREESISFDNCIKLYLNHRPANSFTMTEVEKAFRVLEKDGPLLRVKFVELLCTKGEAFSPLTLHNCFSTLILIETKNIETRNKSWKSLFQEYLPEVITWDYFLHEFLGCKKESA